MAKNMTFSVSLSLLTRNFQKGIKSVQNTLNRFKSQFQTLMGGIGLGMGLQELIETAKNLDKAQTTLKNVSGSIELFGENLKFVETLSSKYNQDLITLTGNFAKFHSAAGYAGMSLEEQQHIYEGLTRAAAYFNLTADETNGVMLAVQQMISKGKVSSEELRRQLGERLPGAMNLAAKAMDNISVAQLEEMIRNGELLASDLLPRLANELFKMTGNFSVDTIMGQTAKLRNTFTDLVQQLNVGNIYHSFLKGLTNGLEYVSKNLRDVAYAIAGTLGALVLKGGIEKGVNTWQSFFKGIEDELTKAKTNIKVFKKELDDIANTPGLPLQPYITNPKNGRIMVSKGVAQHMPQEDYEKLRRLAADYNRELGRSNVLQEQLNNKLDTAGKKLGENTKKLLKMVGIQAIYYAIAAAISFVITKLASWAAEQKRIRNLVRETNEEFEKTGNKLGVDEVELEGAYNKLLDTATTEQEREQVLKRINKLLGLQGDKAFTLASNNEDINKAIEERLALLKEEREYEAAKQVVADAKSRKTILEQEQKGIIGAQGIDLGKIMGQYGGKGMGPIVKKIIELITDVKLSNQFKRNAKEIEQLDKIIAQFGKVIEKGSTQAQNREDILNSTGDYTPDGDGDYDVQKEYKKIQEDYNNKLSALKDKLADGVITQEDYDKSLRNLITSTLDSIYALKGIDENTDEFAKALRDAARKYIDNALNEEYQKIQNEHNNRLRALNERLADGVITQEDYDDAVDKLCQSTLESIYALDNINEHNSKFAQALIDLVKATQKEKENKKKSNDVLTEYYEEVKKLQRQFKDGLITQKELDDALYDLLDEVVKTMSGLGQLSGAAKELADNFRKQKKERTFKEIGEIEKPTPGDFDATMSYKKDTSEMLKEDADLAREYAEDIQDYIEQLSEYQDKLSGPALTLLNNDIATLEERLAALTQQADSFEQAAKFAEIQEDIKSMKKELAEGIWDNITGIASAAERLTSSWKSLTETMEDPDASGWEKFLTIFSTVISTIETIVSVIKTFQTAMQVAEGLSLALTAAEQASIPVEIEKIGVMAAQAAVAKQVAVAKHMSAAASVPYPANIAAIASTSAALISAFAAVPAFASGGVVPGNSTHGDKILARLNSGELVLNGDQQGALWNLLNGKGGMGGSVSFEIRGDKLQGVLNNYNKKIHK